MKYKIVLSNKNIIFTNDLKQYKEILKYNCYKLYVLIDNQYELEGIY